MKELLKINRTLKSFIHSCPALYHVIFKTIEYEGFRIKLTSDGILQDHS